MKCNRCNNTNIDANAKFCPLCYNDLTTNRGFESKKNEKENKDIKVGEKADIISKMLATDPSLNKKKKKSWFEKRKEKKELKRKEKKAKENAFKEMKAFKPGITKDEPKVTMPEEIKVIEPTLSLEETLNSNDSNILTKSEKEIKNDSSIFNFNNAILEKEKPKNKFFKVNNENVKLWAIIGGGIFLLIIGFIVTKIIINNNSKQQLNIKRTLMIYMVGSNLESDNGLATSEIADMLSSKYDENGLNVLIYTGGTNKWSRDIPIDKNNIYKITNGSLVKEKEYEVSSMGESDNLAKFLQYGYDNYKADEYELLLWGNGGGPITGYGKDILFDNDSLSLAELRSALDKTPFKNDNKLEFIGFDACMMGTIETAYMIKDYAKYMIASEEAIISLGWNYNYLNQVKNTLSTEDLLKVIVDNYYDSINSYSSINDASLTMSVLKLSEVDNVVDKLNNMFTELDDDLTLGIYSNVASYRSNTESFGKYTDTYNYDLVDLYDLVDHFKNVSSESSAAIKTAINDMIYYQKNTITGAFGVSIYFPYENKENLNEKLAIYTGLGFANKYTDFIKKFSNMLNGNSLTSWNFANTTPLISANGNISVTLSKDVLANFSNANYYILEKIDNNYYVPRYISNNTTLSNDVISANLIKKEVRVYNNDNSIIVIGTLNEVVNSSKYSKMLLRVNLLKNAQYINGYLQIAVDEINPSGALVDVVPITENSTKHFAPKKLLKYSEGSNIKIINYRYRLFDSSGNYNSNWINNPEEFSTDIQVNTGINVNVYNVDVNKEYYALLELKDTQNKSYFTNIVRIK